MTFSIEKYVWTDPSTAIWSRRTVTTASKYYFDRVIEYFNHEKKKLSYEQVVYYFKSAYWTYGHYRTKYTQNVQNLSRKFHPTHQINTEQKPPIITCRTSTLINKCLSKASHDVVSDTAIL